MWQSILNGLRSIAYYWNLNGDHSSGIFWWVLIAILVLGFIVRIIVDDKKNTR